MSHNMPNFLGASMFYSHLELTKKHEGNVVRNLEFWLILNTV